MIQIHPGHVCDALPVPVQEEWHVDVFDHADPTPSYNPAATAAPLNEESKGIAESVSLEAVRRAVVAGHDQEQFKGELLG